jgi:hypothetical protein
LKKSINIKAGARERIMGGGQVMKMIQQQQKQQEEENKYLL